MLIEYLNFLCIDLGRREDFHWQGRKRRLSCAKPSISNEAGQSRNRHKVYTKNSIALIAACRLWAGDMGSKALKNQIHN